MPEKQQFPKKGTVLWKLATGDWRGMNLRQIAEEMDSNVESIRCSMRTLKANYQIEIDYDSRPVREMEAVPDDLATLSEHSAVWKLIHQDWSDYTLAEVSKVLHKNLSGVKAALEELERKHGIKIPLKVEPPPQKMAGFKKRIDRTKYCKSCIYWNPTVRCCDYLAIVGCRRPCPPGDECTVHKRQAPRRRKKTT